MVQNLPCKAIGVVWLQAIPIPTQGMYIAECKISKRENLDNIKEKELNKQGLSARKIMKSQVLRQILFLPSAFCLLLYILAPPMEGHWKFQGGWGSHK